MSNLKYKYLDILNDFTLYNLTIEIRKVLEYYLRAQFNQKNREESTNLNYFTGILIDYCLALIKLDHRSSL